MGFGGDCPAGPEDMVQVVMSEDRNCTAEFAAVVGETADLTVLIMSEGGTGSVVSDPTGIDCGAQCTATFDSGTSVELTAIPDGNFVFSRWGGDPDCTDGNVIMVTDRQCEAYFALPAPAALTVTKNGAGTGTVTSTPAGIDCGATCSADFDQDTNVTLSAIPDPGSLFAAWGGDADCDDGVVDLSTSMSCTVTFDLVGAPTGGTLTITAVSGAGTIQTLSGATPDGLISCVGTQESDPPTGDCNESYPLETMVTLDAVPDAGWEFLSWGGACVANEDQNPIQVMISGDTNCTAAFGEEPPPPQFAVLTMGVVPNDTGTVISTDGGIDCRSVIGSDCSHTLPFGSTVTLQAIPDPGFTFQGWSQSMTQNCAAFGNQKPHYADVESGNYPLPGRFRGPMTADKSVFTGDHRASKPPEHQFAFVCFGHRQVRKVKRPVMSSSAIVSAY